jgi:hypothetical protein
MQSRKRNRYTDAQGREKRVDKTTMSIIAKHSEANARHVYVLDPKRSPERLGKRRKQRY